MSSVLISDAVGGPRLDGMTDNQQESHPMQHPRNVVSVARDGIHYDLKHTLLSARRSVKRAVGECSVRQLRKDIWRDKAKPCDMIARILLTDLRDGAPLDHVLEFPRRLIAILEAQSKPMPAKPIDALIDELSEHETLVQGDADCAQLRIASDKSETALREAREKLGAHHRVQGQLIGSIDQALFGRQATA